MIAADRRTDIHHDEGCGSADRVTVECVMKFRPWGWKVAVVADLGSLALYLASSVPVLSEEKKCSETDAGLSLPNGFCATIFADNVGHARQLVVAPDGTV